MAGYYGDHIKDPLDRQLIAEQYAIREMAAERTGGKFQKEPIDVWLQYKPWASAAKEAIYLDKIEKGDIPELSWYSFFRQEAYDEQAAIRQINSFIGEDSANHLFNLVMYTLIVAGLMDDTDKPYLLPSQNKSALWKVDNKFQKMIDEIDKEVAK